MIRNLPKRAHAKRLFRYVLGVIIITLQVGAANAQIFTENFNGTAFPPVGPPSISNPVSSGVTDEGEVKWYRGDTIVVTNGSTSNAGINPGRGGTGFAACFNSWDIASGAKADLIVNDIDLSSISPYAVVKFWMINTSGTDVVKVYARNGTDPFVQVGNASYGVFATFTEITISLQAFSGPGKTTVDLKFEGTSDYGATNMGIDDISIALPSPMSFVSSTSFQKSNDVEIFKPLPNQVITQLTLVSTGVLNALVPSTFYMSTAGTTNVSDIQNARLWTTAGTATFNPATATQVGSTIASPSGTMTFSGITNAMVEGNNFYWLTYDVKNTATLGNLADATFDSVLVSGVMKYPTLASPTPARKIAAAAVIYTNAIAGSSSGNGRGPTTQSLFNRTLSIYPATDYPSLKAGDSISIVGFNILALGAAQATVSGNIKIYLSNTADASFLKSTTWATAITDMTLVYDGPLTINPEVGSYDIRLQNKFGYTGGGIYLGYDWALTTAVSTAATYDCNSTTVGGGNGLRNIFGATQGATLTGTSAFRPAARFGKTSPADDISVEAVYALTQSPGAAANPQQVSALIKNNGFNTKTAYTVTLNVTGANTFTNTKTVTLAFNESVVVTFDAFSPTTAGANTITVSVGADDVATNNSKSVTQTVNSKVYSYSEPGANASAVGYNTGAGIIANKYKATGGWLVDSVKVFIPNTAAINTKKMFGVVLNSQGQIIAKSDTFTASATDLGKLKSFAIVNPKVVYNEDFYVGLSQVANAAGFFPIGTQIESPARAGAYYTTSSAGGTMSENATLGRFMIDASIAVPATPQTVNIGNDTSICDGTSILLDAGNAGMTYLWSTGATTQTISVNATGTYSVTVRNSQGYPVTDSKLVTVNPILPVSVNIAASPTGTICAGQSVTFTATPTNGGTAPAYQWLKNGTLISGETSSTLTSTTLANGDIISAILVSNEKCKSGSPDTSNTITMSVSAGAAAVTVSVASSSPAGSCDGSSVTLTATPSNGGAAPTYAWKLNGNTLVGETGATLTRSNFANNDSVTCTLTSNSACILGNATVSNGFKLKVNPILPVSVSVASSATGTICKNQSVTFTATPTNGGTAPTYVWKINGTTVAGQTGATFTTTSLFNGDTVRSFLTSSETCQSGGPAKSNDVIISVSPVADAQFTATSNNRTASFTNNSLNSTTYSWDFGDATAADTSANPTHTYAADGTYAVRLISSNLCGHDTTTKNVVIATVDVKPLALIGLSDACTQSPIAPIRVSVQNTRAIGIANVKVAYQVNNGPVVNGLIANINASATVSYPFTQRADLSADGTYKIKVWTNDSLDFDRTNDTITVTIVNQARPNAGFVSVAGTNGAYTFNNTTTSDVTANYAWDFGDGGTSTNENPTHTYTQSGTYTVTMIATNACGSDTTSETNQVVVSGVAIQANERYVRAYPNPNNGMFNLDVRLNNADDITINIYNVSGQIVYTQKLGVITSNNVSLDLSTLSAGVYNVNISGKNTQIVKRVNIIK